MRNVKLQVFASSAIALSLVQVPGLSSAQVNPSQAVKSLVVQLLERNDSIRAKQLLKKSADAEIERAEGKFDPILAASISHGLQKEPNTAEEAVTRSGDIYQRDASDYAASVSKLFATGAQFEAKLTFSRFMTSAIQAVQPGQPPNVRAYYGLSMMQPLMRDAGSAVSQASVNWARLDADATVADIDDTRNTVVAQGLLVFYDLQAAIKREQIAAEKMAMATRLLVLAKKAKKAGRVTGAEVWDVENSLDRFRVAALEAAQNRVEQHNRLQTLLMTEAKSDAAQWADALPQQAQAAGNAEDLLSQALAHRGDYRRQKLMLERAESQLAYADNQRQPRVDLSLNYGQNGLSYYRAQALSLANTKDTPTWSVGLQFQAPLGKNRPAEAGYVQARARVDEASLSLQALEVSIRNEIDSSLRLVDSVSQRWAQWADVAKREQEQLILERKRLENGRSDLRELLFKEERNLNAQMSVVEQQASYAKALVLQQAASGTLVQAYVNP